MFWTGLKTKRTLTETNLRACLHGGEGPQLGEVTCLGGVTCQSIYRASDISRGRGPVKFRYFSEIPQNTAKSARNISKYMSAKHI